jgi:cyanophycinase-like exopeptidase
MVMALQKQLKAGQRMIGVDEDTALVGALDGEWKTMGTSSAHLFTREGKRTYKSGDVVRLS